MRARVFQRQRIQGRIWGAPISILSFPLRFSCGGFKKGKQIWLQTTTPRILREHGRWVVLGIVQKVAFSKRGPNGQWFFSPLHSSTFIFTVYLGILITGPIALAHPPPGFYNPGLSFNFILKSQLPFRCRTLCQKAR